MISKARICWDESTRIISLKNRDACIILEKNIEAHGYNFSQFEEYADRLFNLQGNETLLSEKQFN